jgi:hypothetical protein
MLSVDTRIEPLPKMWAWLVLHSDVVVGQIQGYVGEGDGKSYFEASVLVGGFERVIAVTNSVVQAAREVVDYHNWLTEG